VGNQVQLRRCIILTTSINQLANENQIVLFMRNGAWAQLTELEVISLIQWKMYQARTMTQIMVPVEVDVLVIESRTKANWNAREEMYLCDW
jgi:hypothetical protein